MFPRLGIDLVRDEAFRRAERLAEHGLAPTTAVALCDLRAPSAVLTREQWAVACRIGAHASALDLAARRGAALIDTLECLGSLTRAGLCARFAPAARAAGLAGPCAGPPERAVVPGGARTVEDHRAPARASPGAGWPGVERRSRAGADGRRLAPGAQRAEEAQLTPREPGYLRLQLHRLVGTGGPSPVQGLKVRDHLGRPRAAAVAAAAAARQYGRAEYGHHRG